MIWLIPYTIFIVTMTGLWTNDQMFNIDKCYKGQRFRHENSVFKCTEEQRLMFDKHVSKPTDYGPLDCNEVDCE